MDFNTIVSSLLDYGLAGIAIIGLTIAVVKKDQQVKELFGERQKLYEKRIEETKALVSIIEANIESNKGLAKSIENQLEYTKLFIKGQLNGLKQH